MITAATYSSVTGAPVPVDFDDLQDRVVARLEAALGRGLASTERTEHVTVYADGIAYPWAYPVTDADTGVERGDTIDLGRGAARMATVTYTGGYTDETCPADLAAGIAWGIHTLRNPQATQIPDGVTSLNIAGEYAITREAGSRLGADGVALPGAWAERIADLGGRCAQLVSGYRNLR